MARVRPNSANRNAKGSDKVNNTGWYDMGDGWECPSPYRTPTCRYNPSTDMNRGISQDTTPSTNKTVQKGIDAGIIPDNYGAGSYISDVGDRPYLDPNWSWWMNSPDEDGDGIPDGHSVREHHPGKSRPARQHPECFVAGTKIIMKNGPDRNIEDIVAGDEVLSYNVHTKQIEPKLVKNSITQTHDLKDGDITVKIKI